MDRISCLHDAILSHILSNLPTDAAIRTKVLSKQWRNLWFPTQELVFCQTSQNAKLYLQGIACFINSTLCRLNTFPEINKYEIRVKLGESVDPSRSLINKGLKAAILRHVRDVVIDIQYESRRYYILPKWLCSYASLERLTLRHSCCIIGSSVLCWTSLKALIMEFNEVNDDNIKSILEGCPKLEHLELNQCDCSFYLIDANLSNCLRKLVIIEGDQASNSQFYSSWTLIISAPKVECLILKLNRRIELKDVSSLVDVTLDFSNLPQIKEDKLHSYHGLLFDEYFVYHLDEYCNEMNSCRDFLMKLFTKVGHVERVTLLLGAWFVKVVSENITRGVPSLISLPECKCLVLETPVSDLNLPGILTFLRSSPNLETLVIKSTSVGNDVQSSSIDKRVRASNAIGAKVYWKKHKNFSKQLLQHLKVVRIIGLCTLLVDVAQLLLQNGKFMEKMILTKSFGTDDELLIIQKIMKLPRSSPNVKISVC